MTSEDNASIQPAAKNTRLSPHVAKQLRDMIMSGKVAGDTRLRAEHLAEELGVSATPVREALMALAGEGMVAFEPGRGFRVIQMTRQDIIDLYDMQAYLSGELAGRAAKNLTSAEYERLEDIQRKLVDAVDACALDEVEQLDFQFHQLINRAADSPKLIWMLSLTLRYVPFSLYGDIPGWEHAARDDHAPIFRGLRVRSSEAASEAMRAHIRTAGVIIADLLVDRGVIIS